MISEDVTNDDAEGTLLLSYLAACELGETTSQAELLGQSPALVDYLDQTDGVAAGLAAFRHGWREPDLSQPDERVLGDYELLERIGGNMAAVYRARQISLPREVALKVLLRAGPTDRDQFSAEAHALARLRHANIVPVYEVVRTDHAPAFSMEWCPHGTLAARSRTYLASPDRAAELIEVLAKAIHHAHERGLLHRDLKPSNVLFDEADQPRIADFGLVQPIQTDGSWCGVAGTPAYMAPEQFNGEATVRTDVYGLGAILYELLTGRPPAKGSSFVEVREQVRAGSVPAPRTINPLVSPELDAICRKCLSRAPSERYPSAIALEADLVRYRNGQPTEALPLGLLGRVGHQLRQARSASEFRGMASGIVIAALVTLACDVAVFWLLRQRAPEPWIWLFVFASYGPLVAAFAIDWRSSRGRFRPGQLLLWSIWGGHAIACAMALASFRLLAGADWIRGIESGYIACSSINVLAFSALAALVGRLYLAAITWAIATIAMAMVPSLGPLIYGLVMAICGLASGQSLLCLTGNESR